jgi:hypothetical protein
MMSPAELAIPIVNAAHNINRLRAELKDAEAAYMLLVCEKYGCHRGARIIRADSKKPPAERSIWIVTSVDLPRAKASGMRPFVRAVPEKDFRPGQWWRGRPLWGEWEPAP